MSPTPGRSTLITSAPSQAKSCVQVGPDCTCVKSRMRTPVSALPASPHGLFEGLGRPLLPFAFLALDSFITLRADFFAGFFCFLAMSFPPNSIERDLAQLF